MFLQSRVLISFPSRCLLTYLPRGPCLNIKAAARAITHYWTLRGLHRGLLMLTPFFFFLWACIRETKQSWRALQLVVSHCGMSVLPASHSAELLFAFCKPYCTFTLFPPAWSLYSSTTECLSVLYIVISLQPRPHRCNRNPSEKATSAVRTVRGLPQNRAPEITTASP